MLKALIQGASSSNCIFVAAASKCVYSGSDTTKVSAAKASDSQRTTLLPAILAAANTITPPTMGNQMTKLNRNKTENKQRKPRKKKKKHKHEPAQEDQQADDHGEGVVIEESALHHAYDLREPAHTPRGAVHHHAVDHRDIAALPQGPAGRAAAAGEDRVVEVVETVFAIQQAIDAAEAGLDALGEFGPHHVEVVRERNARERDPHRRRHEAVQNEAHWPGVVLTQLGEDVVRRQHHDAAAEKALEQQRPDVEPARHH